MALREVNGPAWWVDNPPEFWFEGGIACFRVASGDRVWEFRSTETTMRDGMRSGIKAWADIARRRSAQILSFADAFAKKPPHVRVVGEEI